MKPTDKNKRREPFDPHKTPQPPQVKNPSAGNEKPKNSPQNKADEKAPQSPPDSGKRLGDETEITDETTI